MDETPTDTNILDETLPDTTVFQLGPGGPIERFQLFDLFGFDYMDERLAALSDYEKATRPKPTVILKPGLIPDNAVYFFSEIVVSSSIANVQGIAKINFE